MRRHLFVALAATLAATLAGCGGPAPAARSTFTSAAFGFSAAMPGTPRPSTTTLKFAPEYPPIPVAAFEADDGDLALAVRVQRIPRLKYNPPPPGPHSAGAEIFCALAHAATQRAGTSTPESNRPVQVEGHDAFEYLDASFDKATATRSRYVLDTPWLWVVEARGPRASVESARATTFLDSLRILPEGPSPSDPAFQDTEPSPRPAPTVAGTSPAKAGPVAMKAPSLVRGTPPAPSTLAVVPDGPGGPLKGPARAGADLVATEVAIEGADVLPCLSWSADGASFYVTTTGAIRRVALDGLREEAKLVPGRRCSWSARSSLGVVLALPDLGEAWLLDPASLAVLRKVPAPGVSRVAASLGSPLAFAAPKMNGGGTGAESVEMLDLAAGASLGVFDSARLGPGSGFNSIALDADGSALFAVGGDGGIVRYRVEPGRLGVEEIGPRIETNTRGLAFSPDGRVAALPSPSGLDLYATADLARAPTRVASDRVPGAVAFLGDGGFLAQIRNTDLARLGPDGATSASYALPGSVAGDRQILPGPAGLPAVLLGNATLAVVEAAPKAKPEPDEPARTPKKKATTPKKKATVKKRP